MGETKQQEYLSAKKVIRDKLLKIIAATWRSVVNAGEERFFPGSRPARGYDPLSRFIPIYSALTLNILAGRKKFGLTIGWMLNFNQRRGGD